MNFKTIQAEIIDLSQKGENEGYVKFYFSIFGNLDSDGDIVEPGAFAKTISDWKGSKKKRIRHFKNHRWDQAPGVLKDLHEDEKGAVAVSQLILGTQLGRETYEEYKAGAIDQHSYGYDVVASNWEEIDNGKIQHLTELKLNEVSSLTSWGANDQTFTLDVKSEDQIMKALERLEKLQKGDFSDEYFEKLENKIADLQLYLASLREKSPGPIEYILQNSKFLNKKIA